MSRMDETTNPMEGVLTLFILYMIRRALNYACPVVYQACAYAFWNGVYVGDTLLDYVIYWSPIYVPLLYIICKY